MFVEAIGRSVITAKTGRDVERKCMKDFGYTLSLSLSLSLSGMNLDWFTLVSVTSCEQSMQLRVKQGQMNRGVTILTTIRFVSRFVVAVTIQGRYWFI